ncbi:MAG TPA: metallophosphoesterase [Campylobacterales bacterium]|nr:metallophosphoesterase [Campylobacterales bacterium]
MKVGVIADTHKKLGRAKKAVDFLIKNGAEYIIHAGDIVRFELLDYLESKKIVYIAVYGNNDRKLLKFHNDFNLVQEPHYFKIGDTTFKLMHHPYYMTPDSDVVIYGHTHIRHVQFEKGTLYLNPGEVIARNMPFSQMALLDIETDRYIVKMFERELGTEDWEEREYRFNR